MNRLIAPIAAVLLVSCALVGCASPSEVVTGGSQRPADCGPGADAASTSDTAATPDIAPQWSLPVCHQACDRVVDCGVADCAGWDWAGAGVLWQACIDTCDPGFADKVATASACIDVRSLVQAARPAFAHSCSENPCKKACDKLAGCVVDVCPVIGSQSRVPIASDCQKKCNPQTTSAVLATTSCEQLITAIADNDANFKTACYGAPNKCPSAETCAPYAAKATTCVVAHCDGNADDWQVGIETVFANFCTQDAKCPTAQDVAWVLAATTTCETKGLDKLGTAPPFTAICAGTLGVTAAQARAACKKLLACPGLEGVGSVDRCMVLFAMRPDVKQRIACLQLAADCNAVYGCLEGL